MEQYLSFVIEQKQAGNDVAGVLLAQGFSKKAISRLKNAEQSFEVAGKRVNSNYILREGDVLRVPIFNQKPPKAQIAPWERDLSIVYEDEYLLVCDKPAGIAMYPHTGGGNGSLANIVAYHYPYQTFHAVNRLDEYTAGLVVLAKNAYVLHQLQNSNIEKYYLLYVQGRLNGAGMIDLPLRHINGQPRVLVDSTGKEARTAYTVLACFTDYSVVMVHLLTGRTHQIRAHMAAIGHPLVGDVLYGADEQEQNYRLLAFRLEIEHPITHEILDCESPQVLCF